MILPGFPTPFHMAGGLPPFSLSGTFATDLDGWTASGFTWNSGSGVQRTAPGIAFSTGSGTFYLERVISKDICAGLTISASIWHRINSGSPTRSLKYKIGSGSFVTLATVTDGSATYAELSGEFENPGDDDVTIRVDTNGAVILDDWSISGS